MIKFSSLIESLSSSAQFDEHEARIKELEEENAELKRSLFQATRNDPGDRFV